ncbi:MAG: hypothetical protein ACI8RL_000225 [Cyclobacteriaceae bacterium]|jgi:hypothetical protein
MNASIHLVIISEKVAKQGQDQGKTNNTCAR